MNVDLRLGNCLDELPTLESESVDAVICDPPYAEIDRPYGRLTESEWWDLMMGVVRETRRVLKPSGSAVFILQPNSRRVGSMRGWVFEFMAWVCREWNMVQDAYWWNTTSMPQSSEKRGLMRSSTKACVWAGDENCYRNQRLILWEESLRNRQRRMEARIKNDNSLQYSESKTHYRLLRTVEAAERRGGVTPFNILPIPNGDSASSAGAYGHGAGTPLELAAWWTRYICPPGGVVADWFMGSGTMGIAAVEHGCSFIGFEKMPAYFEIAQRRIAEARPQLALPMISEATIP